MSFVNMMARELHVKIVYYGPGLGGKTANVEHLYRSAAPGARGKLIQLAQTSTERTLFFDFMPLSLGRVRGLSVRLQLYTVPGQVFYRASRRLVLRGADGVVFVADSQPARFDANVESLEDLDENLAELGESLAGLPHVVQFNKRDLCEAPPASLLGPALNRHGAPAFEAVAREGVGVAESLKAVTKLALTRLRAFLGPAPFARPHPGG